MSPAERADLLRQWAAELRAAFPALSKDCAWMGPDMRRHAVLMDQIANGETLPFADREFLARRQAIEAIAVCDLITSGRLCHVYERKARRTSALGAALTEATMKATAELLAEKAAP